MVSLSKKSRSRNRPLLNRLANRTEQNPGAYFLKKR
jgi:hypothetical protein